MESSNRNRKIHYDGEVTMWQGANRIQANTIDLDREKRGLVADGNVATNLWEVPKGSKQPAGGAAKGSPAKPAAPPVLTEVHAPHLVYTEENRLAIYTGGVLLTRPNIQVKAREIHAYLAESGADSRLEKAFADGAVEIRQTSAGVTHNGTAEHTEYYTANQKVVLLGGMPKMVDSRGNIANGPNGLTYYANDDRLEVTGSDAKPANSRLIRKKK
jgi:lipopolysaccharide export system protein LptA